jgi:hypothetical protein
MNDAAEVILWGESQVGKTSALAAYLCHNVPRWVDLKDAASQLTIATLERIYTTLERNRLPDGTVTAKSYSVRHAVRGVEIRFRDMRGKDAGEPTEEERRVIDASAAVVVFVSWPGQSDVQRLSAAQTPLRLRDDKPRALAVTKVETHLTRTELAAFMANPLEEARKRGLPGNFINLLNEFPQQAIFFISAFGYDEKGLPAQYLDEFGRVVPSAISPVNVQMPFEYVVEEVTCASRP